MVDNYHSQPLLGEGVDINDADLSNLVFSKPVKDKEYVTEVLRTINECKANEQTTTQLISALHTRRLLKEISLSSYEVAEGRQEASKLSILLTSYGENFIDLQDGDGTEQDFLVNDLEAVVNKVVRSPGLRWRLGTMNKMLGSLRKGNFGFIFARPETGKTTFLASEVTFMAEQLKEDSGPILWINNEQVGEEVLLRIYQASLARDTSSLYSNIPAAQQEFLKLTRDKIKVIDRSQIHHKYIETLCKKYKPSLILLDQIDKITGFDSDREDLRLGGIYQWARRVAKDYCPVIAVCQSDGTGEGVMWLTMSHVSNAKTAKQAEADWILGIGKKNDVGFENVRYLHLSKNKLSGDPDTDPMLRHGRRECLIEPMIARFKDI